LTGFAGFTAFACVFFSEALAATFADFAAFTERAGVLWAEGFFVALGFVLFGMAWVSLF
jgi:hypothetical protein